MLDSARTEQLKRFQVVFCFVNVTKSELFVEANYEAIGFARKCKGITSRLEETSTSERCALVTEKSVIKEEKTSAAYSNVADTQIERVFGGLLLQTIVCEECHHVSTRLEPFFDLSLPIATADVSFLIWLCFKCILVSMYEYRCAGLQRRGAFDQGIACGRET